MGGEGLKNQNFKEKVTKVCPRVRNGVSGWTWCLTLASVTATEPKGKGRLSPNGGSRGDRNRESRSSSGACSRGKWVRSSGWENNRRKRLTALCWVKQTHLYSCNAYLQESNAVCFLVYSFRLLTWRKSWWKWSWPHGKYCWSFLPQCW